MNKEGKELKQFIKSEIKDIRKELKGCSSAESRDSFSSMMHQLNIVINKMNSMEQVSKEEKEKMKISLEAGKQTHGLTKETQNNRVTYYGKARFYDDKKR